VRLRGLQGPPQRQWRPVHLLMRALACTLICRARAVRSQPMMRISRRKQKQPIMRTVCGQMWVWCAEQQGMQRTA
jgi:hypothetical protein